MTLPVLGGRGTRNKEQGTRNKEQGARNKVIRHLPCGPWTLFSFLLSPFSFFPFALFAVLYCMGVEIVVGLWRYKGVGGSSA